ncbi:hypothetical protein PPOP_1456 [Paenibacillus popilliae ATCC 14706]|uniref:Hint domain-containing protein n=2 Tax=Paenibacillus popilliae TaxID=78057 RepID=M9M065_PAEPP|nr:hypothetical protein PPOP_1456 [Paenibacillus popilliae ATCC 14706]
MALSFTSLPLAYADFANGTLVQTETGFKPIEQIRVGDLVQAQDETTGKTGYHRVVQLFQGQADKTYHITANGIPITTTGEHPFWVHGRGWVEARHLKAGDLLQNADGKPYPIDRIEMMSNSTSVYNFEVEGVHNYFVTESEIWTHNVVGSIVKAIVQVFAKNAAKSAARNTTKSTGKASKGTGYGADNIAKYDLLKKDLKYTERYGSNGRVQLPDGRIRYYGKIDAAKTPGEMVGRRMVQELNPSNGNVRTWHETLSGTGNIRQVRPQLGPGKTHYRFDQNGNYIGKW